MTVVWVAGHALRDNPHAPRYKSSWRSRDSRPYDENRCIESVLTVASTDLGERIIRCAAKGATAREKSIRPVHRMPGGRGRRIYFRRAGRGESRLSRQPVAVENDTADRKGDG